MFIIYNFVIIWFDLLESFETILGERRLQFTIAHAMAQI